MLRFGLINRVVAADQVLPVARAWAERIAANGPLAVQAVKRTVLAASGLPLAQGYELENDAKRLVLGTEDAREGPQAFMEKRPPVYRGR